LISTKSLSVTVGGLWQKRSAGTLRAKNRAAGRISLRSARGLAKSIDQGIRTPSVPGQGGGSVCLCDTLQEKSSGFLRHVEAQLDVGTLSIDLRGLGIKQEV
jgi:hypothetical protein